MNELYEIFGGKQNPIGNLQNALMQIKQNPVAVLRQAGLNIPDNMNNPQQIVNHLVQSGQINQQRLLQAQKVASKFKK